MGTAVAVVLALLAGPTGRVAAAGPAETVGGASGVAVAGRARGPARRGRHERGGARRGAPALPRRRRGRPASATASASRTGRCSTASRCRPREAAAAEIGHLDGVAAVYPVGGDTARRAHRGVRSGPDVRARR